MTRLEKATLAALLDLALVASASLVAKHIFPRMASMRGLTGRITPIRSVGGHLAIADGGRREETNVVLVLRSDCPYCRASLPLYRRIGSLSRAAGSRLAVHVVSEESPDSMRGYLSSEGLSVDSVFYASLASLHVTGTPTILLANSNHVIEDEYVGMLSGSQEEQLLARLSRRHDRPSERH